MKTFKQFMLESGETGTAINRVNERQRVPLYGQGSTLPPNLTITGGVVSKPNPTTTSNSNPPKTKAPKTPQTNPWWNPQLPNLTPTIYRFLTRRTLRP